MNPFFTVIITTYNRPVKLIRAIQSVLDQTFNNFELIIVNDGSSSDYISVKEYIKPFNNIKYYFKENEERSIARNFGVNKAGGEFICFLDDDDYYLENHLQVLFDEIEKQNYAKSIYHTYSFKLTKSGKIKMPIIPSRKGYNNLEYYVTDGIMTMNNTCGAIEVFRNYPYPIDISYAEDHYQRLTAMLHYKVFPIHSYTAIYDMSDETSTNSGNIETAKAYINTWKSIFTNKEISDTIRRSIKNNIISEKIKLLIQSHRNELTWNEFFKNIVNLKPTTNNILFIFNNLRWKLQNR